MLDWDICKMLENIRENIRKLKQNRFEQLQKIRLEQLKKIN